MSKKGGEIVGRAERCASSTKNAVFRRKFDMIYNTHIMAIVLQGTVIRNKVPENFLLNYLH